MWYLIGILALCFGASISAFAIFDKRAEDAFTPRPGHGTKNEQMEHLLDAWRTGSADQKRALEKKHPLFFSNRRRVFTCMLLILGFLAALFALLILNLTQLR